MHKDGNRAERRARESWRMRACCAGLCVGAQIYLLGAGIAVPAALSGAWIASFAAAAMAALTVYICHRALRAGAKPAGGMRWRRIACAALAAALIGTALFALASLVAAAEQAMIPQARTAVSSIATVLLCLLCALSGASAGDRLCFLFRWALPALLAVLIAVCMPGDAPCGLFPILGAGALPLAAAGVCMLCGAAPALMLLLTPREIIRAQEKTGRLLLPPCSFFMTRVLAGAAAGAALLFALCAAHTYEALAQRGVWGMRLLFAGGGAAHTLLTLSLMAAAVLEAACLLCAGEEALVRAWPRLGAWRMGLWLPGALILAALEAMAVIGYDRLLGAAPAALLPLMIWALAMGRRTAG